MSETIDKIPLNKKIGIALSYLMQALILIYAVYSFCTLNYLYGIWSSFAFFLTLTPLILKRRFDITLSWELSLLIVLALYLHVGRGIRGWYLLFYPFYDKFATPYLTRVSGDSRLNLRGHHRSIRRIYQDE